MTVPVKDVERALEGLKPGSTHTARALYQRYADALAADDREPQHPVSFGVALRAYGCTKHRIRRRVRGVQTEGAGWTLPGPGNADSIAEMIRSFGKDGIYTEDEVYARYVQACVRNRQVAIARPRLMYELTQAGHPRLTHRRRVCRWLNVPS